VKKFVLPMTAIAAFALSASSFAATNSTESLEAQVQALSAQTKQLQHEVWLLSHPKKTKIKKSHALHKTPETQTVETTQTAHATHIRENPEIVSLWHHYVSVTATPYLSRHSSYAGSDLLYNVSSMNEDLLLLQQKQALVNQLAKAGLAIHHPMIQLSGAVEGELYSSKAFTSNSANGGATSGVTLSTGELDVNAIASSWASAFMALDFNGSPVSTGNRAPNSTIYLERGFLTIGNLNKAPVYFTIGEMYSPFGVYKNSMVTTPETQSMMEIRSPTAVLGFSKNNFLASIYTYQGSETSGGNTIFKQGGVNAAYTKTFGSGNSINFGGGWVTNIADSQGMQGTGYNTASGQFGGFGSADNANSNPNNLAHSVGGADANAAFVLGRFTLLGEYLTATEHFAPSDLQYNNVGALPSAEHAEVDYLLPFFAKKYGTALGVSYDHTAQALALNLEQNKYAVFLNTSIWRETIESIEYNYQTDYGTGDTSTGGGATTPIVGTGKGINSVLAEVGVYF